MPQWWAATSACATWCRTRASAGAGRRVGEGAEGAEQGLRRLRQEARPDQRLPHAHAQEHRRGRQPGRDHHPGVQEQAAAARGLRPRADDFAGADRRGRQDQEGPFLLGRTIGKPHAARGQDRRRRAGGVAGRNRAGWTSTTWPSGCTSRARRRSRRWARTSTRRRRRSGNWPTSTCRATWWPSWKRRRRRARGPEPGAQRRSAQGGAARSSWARRRSA
jgi:hypothetical protein